MFISISTSLSFVFHFNDLNSCSVEAKQDITSQKWPARSCILVHSIAFTKMQDSNISLVLNMAKSQTRWVKIKTVVLKNNTPSFSTK
jgi:hypothetical protein